MSWISSPGVLSYALTRGVLSTLSAFHYGDCLESGIIVPSTEDTESPASGDGYMYLVAPELAECGILGYGTNEKRINQSVNACIP